MKVGDEASKGRVAHRVAPAYFFYILCTFISRFHDKLKRKIKKCAKKHIFFDADFTR